MTYYAHTATKPDGSPDADQRKWQPLKAHLENVAHLAAKFATPFGARDEAMLLGLLHDLGKYQPSFQRYLQFGSPRTPHAIHGGAVLSQYRNLANVIASHHAGLHDEDDAHTARLRQLAATPDGQALLQSLLRSYRADGLPSPPKPTVPQLSVQGDAPEDLRLRLLLSALVDACACSYRPALRSGARIETPTRRRGIDALARALPTARTPRPSCAAVFPGARFHRAALADLRPGGPSARPRAAGQKRRQEHRGAPVDVLETSCHDSSSPHAACRARHIFAEKSPTAS